MNMLMCGYHGCHVIDCPLTQECDCTKCSPYGSNGCDSCEKFMGRARRSGWFAKAALNKCAVCKEEAAKKL